MEKKLPDRTLVRQQDQRDCGVACLLSLTRYYGGDSTLEQIRRLSGADLSGTSLLGLKESAHRMGFTAEGYESTVEALREHGKPVVLYVELENKLLHFVVCYGAEGDQFVIGDPAQGMQRWSEDKLRQLWKQGACLVLEPGEDFVRVQEQTDRKRHWFLD